MPLGQFLGTDSKLVTVQGKNWSEIVDDQEAEETKPIGMNFFEYQNSLFFSSSCSCSV